MDSNGHLSFYHLKLISWLMILDRQEAVGKRKDDSLDTSPTVVDKPSNDAARVLI